MVLVGLVTFGSLIGFREGASAAVKSSFDEPSVPGVDSTMYSLQTI